MTGNFSNIRLVRVFPNKRQYKNFDYRTEQKCIFYLFFDLEQTLQVGGRRTPGKRKILSV
jgi:hypothetical protein